MESTGDVELDLIEQRVLGALLEKERTVPDTYPMTLNGLRTACNQSSGRDPVMDISEHEVQAALDRLRPRGLTRVLHPSHGARQSKYRQVLDEVLRLDDGERAIVTLLLLRGSQTPGELRSRSDRLHPFESLDEVERSLTSLAQHTSPLVRELDRQPGQKERRWVHCLGPSAATGARDDGVGEAGASSTSAGREVTAATGFSAVPASVGGEGRAAKESSATPASVGGEDREAPEPAAAGDEVEALRALLVDVQERLAQAEAEIVRLRQDLDDLTAP